LIAHKSIFRNLKELLLHKFFVQIQAYSMQFQAMVDHKKQFRDVFVGLTRSMNDLKILWFFNLYKKATFDGFFDPKHGS